MPGSFGPPMAGAPGPPIRRRVDGWTPAHWNCKLYCIMLLQRLHGVSILTYQGNKKAHQKGQSRSSLVAL